MARSDRLRLPVDLLDAAAELMGRAGRGGTVRVNGRSMEPTLRGGQVLAIEFAPARLRCGDMLVFRQVDYLVVHRLLGRTRRGAAGSYRTRGDGLPGLDPPVDPRRVVGRVVAVESGGRWCSVRGAAARAYGRLVAWHALAWSAARYVALRVEAALRRMRIRMPLGALVEAGDRRLLHGVHRMLFARLHREIPCPPEAASRTPEP
jgi:signal peptidase I